VPPDVADYFLSELAKVFNEEDNLSKLSAFFRFLFGQSHFSPHLRALKTKFPNFFGYSVVKYRKKQKGAATFKSLSRTFASPLLKQFRVF